MPHSFVKIALHIVYSTKGRRRWLSPEIRKELIPYTTTILNANRCTALAINGVEDHIHCLILLSKTLAVSKIVEEMKRSTSRWLKTKSPALSHFAWQGGYSAFSVSESMIPLVAAYIEKQEEHHRHRTLAEEIQLLLEKHKIPYEKRWLGETD